MRVSHRHPRSSRWLLLASAILVVTLCVVSCSRHNSLPLSPRAVATTDASSMRTTLLKVNPFMANDGSSVRFDRVAAAKSGLSDYQLAIGSEIADLATDVLAGRQIDETRFSRYVPFFRSIVADSSDSTGEHGDLHAAPSLTETHCPPVASMSVVDGKAYALSQGYHLVPQYASLNYGRDYAKFLTTSHWPASYWPFWTYRAQIVVREDNHAVNMQSPEPNPELAAYPWPIYPGNWWGPFVYWWHHYFC